MFFEFGIKSRYLISLENIMADVRTVAVER